MVRIFSAIEIDDDELLKELSYVRDTINLGFKPVETSKMHITLEFFNDISREGVEEYKKQLRSTELGGFSSEVRGISSFPSQDHIRVVWAGLADEKKVRELYKIISHHDLESSNKHNFKPHITVLRVEDINKRRKKRLKTNIREFQDYRFGELDISKIKLFESKITNKGSKYNLLEEFEL